MFLIPGRAAGLNSVILHSLWPFGLKPGHRGFFLALAFLSFAKVEDGRNATGNSQWWSVKA